MVEAKTEHFICARHICGNDCNKVWLDRDRLVTFINYYKDESAYDEWQIRKSELIKILNSMLKAKNY